MTTANRKRYRSIDLQWMASRAAVRRGDPIPGLQLGQQPFGRHLRPPQFVRRLGATTTIFFPDVSHYDLGRGVRLESGTVAVIAKSTHGTRFLDSGYGPFKSQAATVGAYFTTYHWLNHGSGAAQADYCFAAVGSTPVMVDAEDTSANTGYNGALVVGDIVDFVTRLRRIGGVCNLCYLPHWYWQNNMGSPDLSPLGALGVGLVSSYYTTYSDTGPGWNGYGGLPVAQWQYSDNLPYGGSYTDFNAYLGPIEAYKQFTSAGGWVDPMADLNIDAVNAMASNNAWEHGRVQAMAWLNKPTDGPEAGGASDLPFVAWAKRVETKIDAAAAGDATRDAATLAAITALSSGGGSVDAAVITNAIATAAADVKTLVEQRHAEEMAALRQEHDAEVASLQARLAALTPPTP